LFGKVPATLARVEAGEAAVRGHDDVSHDEARAPLRARLRQRVSGKTA
jgi:hypothetical protein